MSHEYIHKNSDSIIEFLKIIIRNSKISKHFINVFQSHKFENFVNKALKF
jgi:hypothetical protein